MDVVKRIFDGYGASESKDGEGRDGHGPQQKRIAAEGSAYLNTHFPKLSYIKGMRFI